MKNIKYINALVILSISFISCKKDVDPIFILPPSSGAEITLNGIATNEAGSAAGNSVYVDLSANAQTSVKRNSWDIGFYCRDKYRVVLNNTASAAVKVLSKNNLADVNATDTIGLTLATSQTNPLPEQLPYFDNAAGDLTKTAIPEIVVNDADNKVIILNRGTGGGIAARPWIKLKIVRNATGGYTIQYAGIQETTFKTVQIAKDAIYNFKCFSFDNGVIDAQPEKEKWDFVWSYSVFETNFGAGPVPYNFSDLIAINYLAGVTVASKIYSNATLANEAYTNFNKDSVATISLLNNRWAIGSGWRSTQPSTGARFDRFYVLKDANNNYYKLKCLDMGINDGGVRGKPKFKYALVK